MNENENISSGYLDKYTAPAKENMAAASLFADTALPVIFVFFGSN